MIKLADKESCTACGACAFVCAKNCITMIEDEHGSVYPSLDSTNCVECGRCQKTCPILSPLDVNTPQIAYSAWSSDEKERETSASGGIAAEIYKKAVSEGCDIAGAVQQDDFSVVMQLSSDEKAILKFKNSKYVFSEAWHVYQEIKQSLKADKNVVFIGLPCQVAALRKIFRENEKILFVEVVCHGTAPFSYLKQHIEHIEHTKNEKAIRMSFRDPDTYTYTFTFTLYNKDGKRFYAEVPRKTDTYQYAYHSTISYRENCYHCHFAREQRIADITLSDYKGLGRMAPCSYGETNVSCILVNTEKGKKFIKEMIQEKRIYADERPVREPIEGDPQLRQPSLKGAARMDFERLIKVNDFETTMQIVMKRDKRRKKIHKICHFPIDILRNIKHSLS
ncbi:Coenzyme F420 hydrogenase/dehydrogenase, beta subunit C-terminal domain [Segatella hominis]|uniref:Coenzyme F420 hydrogenase/dehydrogenase, beta subunit C-terminal domain n=1 Tax=Segatella hominis TaxID=2518605 RepID=UPI003F821918